MDSVIDFGPCCGCERSAPAVRVRNVVLLNKRSPSPGPGCWGCLVCGLPSEGAAAVLCDDCLESDNIRFAVVGAIEDHNRTPIEALTEPFEHNMDLHRGEDQMLYR